MPPLHCKSRIYTQAVQFSLTPLHLSHFSRILPSQPFWQCGTHLPMFSRVSRSFLQATPNELFSNNYNEVMFWVNTALCMGHVPSQCLIVENTPSQCNLACYLGNFAVIKVSLGQ